MGRTTKIWKCNYCGHTHISLRYYECNCLKNKKETMNTKAKAFHLYFSIIRDIIADDKVAKLITNKVVEEIIQSHLHIHNPENVIETIKYWQEVKQEIIKL
jgi:hypothetical protein